MATTHTRTTRGPFAAIRFKAKLLQPAKPGKQRGWLFLVLPKSASAALPRRGRTSVSGTLNDHPFQATLEPDGRLSHWLKIDKVLLKWVGAAAGDTVNVGLAPSRPEPLPQLPLDLRNALEASPASMARWKATTALARVDWIHWLDCAKQARTRASRIASACDMLANGKGRVCCFDPSGYYSKSLSAPQVKDSTQGLRKSVRRASPC